MRLAIKASSKARSKGFDIVHPFTVQQYNKRINNKAFELPTFSRPNTLGILIGNTKSVWKPFLRDLKAQLDAGSPMPEHPFDSFVTRSVEEIVESTLNPNTQRVIRFAHDLRPGHLIPMQRLAHLVGYAPYSEVVKLNIHPIFGPWISFRAVVVVDEDSSDVRDYGPNEDLLPKAAVPVLSAMFEEAMAANSQANGWQRWLAMREAVPIGRNWRYEPSQLVYHYTGNKEVLLEAIQEL